MPSKVTINKNIDNWTEVKTNWSSPITREFSTSDDSQTTELLSSTIKETEFMREATQEFEIEGFSPNEKLKELKFDGINIQPQA